MIVHRITCEAKRGRSGELVEVAKAVKKMLPNPDAMRIYTAHPAGAPAYQVITDMEFENLAALEQWLVEWFANPEAAELMRKMEALQEPGGGTTIWDLHQ